MPFKKGNSLAHRHGHSPLYERPTPEYTAWANMIQRCTNRNHDFWKDYGGRGIRVCPRWSSFEHFLADLGRKPTGMTLDRYPDNNGNYEPGNCRWATLKEQAANKRPHPGTKITGEIAREMFALRGSTTQATIAARFGVSPSIVSLLLNNKKPTIQNRK